MTMVEMLCISGPGSSCFMLNIRLNIMVFIMVMMAVPTATYSLGRQKLAYVLCLTVGPYSL